MPIGSASSQRHREGGDLAPSDSTKKGKAVIKGAVIDTTRISKDIDKLDNELQSEWPAPGQPVPWKTQVKMSSMRAKEDTMNLARAQDRVDKLNKKKP